MDQIPFNRLTHQHDASVNEALLSVVNSDWFIMGEKLRKFETEYAAFTGVKHCVGAGNGHDSLMLCLRSLGLGEGDEVIVPAHTYVATWLAVTNAGCIPVPVEPCGDTLNIDPFKIEERITARTRAIIPVHLYGNPCDMNAIMEIAARRKVYVVEDNAQAHGAAIAITGRWLANGLHQQNRTDVESGTNDFMEDEVEKTALDDRRIMMRTGSFGRVNATSFYPTKNLGALGDGGAVTTSDDKLATRIRELRNYGFSSKGVCDITGFNSRLDEIQAAVLSVKLTRLEMWNQERIKIANIYSESLSNVGDLILPEPTTNGRHVYHLYVIRSRRRQQLKAHLAKAGIETMVHYPIAPHMQKAYGHLGYFRGDFPLTEQLSDQVLSLPVFIGMTEIQVRRVAEVIRRFFEN